MSEQTPLMKQYFSIKEKYKDAIVFFRLGDFYEMFGEDAKIASSVLQITLTSRNKDSEEPIPMCGIPHFTADSYIPKLLSKGYKVAICEQVEDPKLAKGIVHREVVRIITPGTFIPEQPKENSYILSFYLEGNRKGIAVADVSTGEFLLYETSNPIEDEVARFQPKEILCPSTLRKKPDLNQLLNGAFISYYDDSYFDFSEAYRTLLKHFRVISLEGYGCENMNVAISSAGALINYLTENYKEISFRKISVFKPHNHLFIDSITCKNLEILENLRDGSIKNTLLTILDETITPMGGRFFRNAITKPLTDLSLINKRLNAIENLCGNYELLEYLKTILQEISDIERITIKIVNKSANPREVIALRNSLKKIAPLKGVLKSSLDLYLNELSQSLLECFEIVELIDSMVVDNPPVDLSDGGIIKSGYDKEVDELREISKNAKDFIAKLEIKERQRTSISSLKIGYNKIFGYYIEVTKANLKLIPQDYIRKQTLVNSERFITQELKEYETKILEAENRLKELETELFHKLLNEIKGYEEQLLTSSRTIAIIDFLYSLALVAKNFNYTKPSVNDGDVIEIIEGRHPVLERIIGKDEETFLNRRFIPNDIYLDGNENRLIIITGPNMAGKSTYMRQVALIVMMAQMGSFVPAKSATIGIVDRIFTRIGASDLIAKGHSTFMVEMIETANILNNATKKSLILLDEVGRGTSTYDGMSIAWAVVEYIAKTLKSRTLFATHYHELTEVVFSLDGAKNYNAVVKEWGDEIIFLYRIEKGSADKSYGIQVARLAGLPQEVIERAKIILNKLEKRGLKETVRASQLSLFYTEDPIILELININVDSLTPKQALKKLKVLKDMAKNSLS